MSDNPVVVVTDYTFDNLELEKAILSPLGADLRSYNKIPSPSELKGFIAEADHIITQFAPLTAEVLAHAAKARVIVRYGIGVDNVDLGAAAAQGIPVCNVPDYCIHEVADHTLALMLSLTRNILPATLKLRRGDWGLAVPLASMLTLDQLTVGIIGFGRIGQAVSRRLNGFQCRQLVHDPFQDPTRISEAGAEPVSLEGLLRESDIVTLHCPATAETRGIIHSGSLAQMKPGALIINLARGSLIDTDALVDALQSRDLGGAGLDVFDPEPLPPGHPLLEMENVIVSSHIASASANAVQKLRETVARIVVCSIRNEPLPNIVNGVKV